MLHHDDVQPADEDIDFDALNDRACAQIAAMDPAPDAIVGNLGFPVTSLVALLNRDPGLKGASPETVAGCEHKFWMREAQREIFSGDTPPVTAANPVKLAVAKELISDNRPFTLEGLVENGETRVVGAAKSLKAAARASASQATSISATSRTMSSRRAGLS